MKEHHDVHVFLNILYGGWKVTQGKRVLASSRSWDNGLALGIRFARRARVDLVVHGRDGRIRSKDSYGNESPTRDTEH